MAGSSAVAEHFHLKFVIGSLKSSQRAVFIDHIMVRIKVSLSWPELTERHA
jgi:hypothetical protein